VFTHHPNSTKHKKLQLLPWLSISKGVPLLQEAGQPIKRRGSPNCPPGQTDHLEESHPLNCYWFLPLSECRQKNEAVKDLLAFDGWKCSKGVVLRMGLCKKKGVSFIEVGF
jgi:hypothetical protein